MLNGRRLRLAVRALLAVAPVLFLSSLATCYLGVGYEVNQIPPATRAGMSDTDWVGVEWIERGGLLLAASLAAGVGALVLSAVWFYRFRDSKIQTDD